MGGAEKTAPHRARQANRPGSHDEYGIAGREPRRVNAVQRHREWFDQGAASIVHAVRQSQRFRCAYAHQFGVRAR